jgi:transposase-like protein
MTIDELKQRWNEALSYRGWCPLCAGECVWHNGIRLRSATLVLGEQTVFVADIPVRRLRCGDCSARWSHAPEGVSTKAHYQPCVVSEAVAKDVLEAQTSDTQVAKEHGCHRRTVPRWISRVAQVAEPASLMRLVLLESGAPVIPALPPVIRPRRSSSLAALCQRAALVLCLLEALCSHRGLCPPGLGHAQELVPALVSPSGAAREADCRA